jgi:hypothetical protein
VTGKSEVTDCEVPNDLINEAADIDERRTSPSARAVVPGRSVSRQVRQTTEIARDLLALGEPPSLPVGNRILSRWLLTT